MANQSFRSNVFSDYKKNQDFKCMAKPIFGQGLSFKSTVSTKVLKSQGSTTFHYKHLGIHFFSISFYVELF